MSEVPLYPNPEALNPEPGALHRRLVILREDFDLKDHNLALTVSCAIFARQLSEVLLVCAIYLVILEP